MTSTSVGMRCPECARERTRVRRYSAAYADQPTATYILIGINVAVALGSLLSGGSAASGGVGSSSILSDGAVSRHAIADGEYWRLLTAGFLALRYALFHEVARESVLSTQRVREFASDSSRHVVFCRARSLTLCRRVGGW